MVTKEQEADFKKRRANSQTVTVEEVEKYERPKLTKAQYLAFLKATDNKCDGDG